MPPLDTPVHAPPSADAVRQMLARGNQCLQKGDAAAAAKLFRQVLDRDPDNDAALVRLGTMLCGSGELAKGIDYLTAAHGRRPDDGAIRNNLMYARNEGFKRSFADADFAAAAGHCRGLLAIDPANEGYRQNLFYCLSKGRLAATLEDFRPDFAPDSLGAKIIVACMPKSGSTWLATALRLLTGYDDALLSAAYFQNEQELDLAKVSEHAGADTVTQQHCRATEANLQIMQAFGFKPVVLVRNLFDLMVSLADYYDTGAVDNTFFHKEFGGLDRDAKLGLIVDLVAPWYVQFYASWAIAEQDDRLPFLWMTYEEMMADKPAALARIGDFHGLHKSDADIAAALAGMADGGVQTRFNKGVSGRGEALLSQAQKDRVRRLASHFPSLDFTRVGLA